MGGCARVSHQWEGASWQPRWRATSGQGTAPGGFRDAQAAGAPCWLVCSLAVQRCCLMGSLVLSPLQDKQCGTGCHEQG